MNNHCISAKQFSMVATFIQDNFGIKLPPSKKVMLSSRLLKRMKRAGFSSINRYVDYVFSPEGQRCELVHMVDVVTTNKTDFFREASHFKILCEKILPILSDEKRFQSKQSLRVWSSACSSGEEPYTLAMTLSEFAGRNKGFHFSILASDISTRVLKKAKRAIYDEERIADVPKVLRKKYLLKSMDRAMRLVQFKPVIRNLINFRQINLMNDDFDIKEKMDIIFCRNVLIYFDKETQEALMHRFAKQLAPGGFLFIGHSESLSGMDIPFKQFMPTIYQKK